MVLAISLRYLLIQMDKLAYKNAEAGQTIIEATIALASILLTLAAITVAITTSVNNSQFIKIQSQAGKFAQDGMEQLRYLRNTNSATFFSREGIYCLNEDSSLVPGSCGTVNLAGIYKREAEFEQAPLTECVGVTKVVVTVYWASGKCDAANTFCHKSQLVSCFNEQSDASTL